MELSRLDTLDITHEAHSHVLALSASSDGVL